MLHARASSNLAVRTIFRDRALFKALDLHKTPGAIAQLGERDNGIVEVEGSTPSGSTNFRAKKPLCYDSSI